MTKRLEPSLILEVNDVIVFGDTNVIHSHFYSIYLLTYKIIK